jgi:hypothetical protein
MLVARGGHGNDAHGLARSNGFHGVLLLAEAAVI